jgi:orotate phosphoribosyltransferase
VKGALLSSEGYKISNGLTQLLECAGETKKVFADKDGSVHAFGYGYGGVILCAQYLHSTVFRGEKKEHGLGNEPIGRVPEEFNHFMILEDVVTTESSVRACLDEIVTHYYAREESLENIPVFCVVDRRQEEDIKLKNVYALFTEKEILERIKEDGLFFSPI